MIQNEDSVSIENQDENITKKCHKMNTPELNENEVDEMVWFIFNVG
jgi:hypothetical protein